MDHLSCHVIYVNRMVGEDRLVRPAALSADGAVDDAGPGRWERDRIKDLVRPLLDAFGDGSFAHHTSWFFFFYVFC